MDMEAFLADVRALFTKHGISEGMLVVPNEFEFLLFAHDFTHEHLYRLGMLLSKHIPEIKPHLNS